MKVLFLDTESTDLAGAWGHLLCASFISAELGREDSDVYTFRIDQAPWVNRLNQYAFDATDDRKLALAIKDEIDDHHCVVGWNSKLHDIPLINARLAFWGEKPVQPNLHVDLMYYARGNSMKIGSSRLDNVSLFFQTDDKKTKTDGALWQAAAAGNKDAIDEIAYHCEQDTKVLRQLWDHLIPYVRNIHR